MSVLQRLRCRRLRSRLVDCAEGTLDEAEKREIERHLSGCARCAADLETLREAPARLRSAAAEREPEVRLRERREIMRRIRQLPEPAASRPLPSRPRIPASAVAAVATAAIVAAVGLWRLQETFRPRIQFADTGAPVPNDVAALENETLLALLDVVEVIAPSERVVPGVEGLTDGDLEALSTFLGPNLV